MFVLFTLALIQRGREPFGDGASEGSVPLFARALREHRLSLGVDTW